MPNFLDLQHQHPQVATPDLGTMIAGLLIAAGIVAALVLAYRLIRPRRWLTWHSYRSVYRPTHGSAVMPSVHIIIENAGTEAARDIEILVDIAPDRVDFRPYPYRASTQATGADGEVRVGIGTLRSDEKIGVSLSVAEAPAPKVRAISWCDGFSKPTAPSVDGPAPDSWFANSSGPVNSDGANTDSSTS